MSQHVLLDNVTHKDLRIDRRFEPGQGYDVNFTRVLPVELPILQAEYPLFLFKNPETGHFEPVALLGFEDGENLYLGGDRWLANTMPLTIDRLPFLIGFQEQDNDGIPTQAPVVYIDMGHPSVSATEGQPVFLPHGGESPVLERANALLAAIHESQGQIQEFSDLLVGLELVESLELDIEFNDGSHCKVQGLSTINDEKLQQLNGGALEALHVKGHLQSVYMMLASLPRLSLLIERKNQRLSEA